MEINHCFIGLSGNDTNGDPRNFFFVDSSTEGLDFVQSKQPGEFPWANLDGFEPEPNDLELVEDCVR